MRNRCGRGEFELTRHLDLLRSQQILIVEDKHFMTDQTRRVFETSGAVIIGPARSVDKALDLLEQVRIDAAILDINLDPEAIFPLVDKLDERGVPFVFVTGDEKSAMPGRYRGFVLCDKPEELASVAAALFGPEPRGQLSVD